MAKKETAKIESADMSLEEARAYRKSLHKPIEQEASKEEIREEFRLYWAQEKASYGKSKDLEEILWKHLQAAKMDKPEQFKDGIAHFGLKKIR